MDIGNYHVDLTALLVFTFVAGWTLGVALTHWARTAEMRSKAKSGIRLLAGNRLYIVKDDTPWDRKEP